MKVFGYLIAVIFLSIAFMGCTHHYVSHLPIQEKSQIQPQKNTAVAGILDRRGVSGAGPAHSLSATKILVEKANLPDVSGKINAEDLVLLLKQPIELSLAAAKLRDLKQRLGYRYVLVGEQGGDPATVRSFWDMGMIVPLGVIIVYFTIPIETSREHGIMHATRVLRVIDLEQAQIASESYALLRDRKEESEFSGGEISDGLSNMKLAKE